MQRDPRPWWFRFFVGRIHGLITIVEGFLGVFGYWRPLTLNFLFWELKYTQRRFRSP